MRSRGKWGLRLLLAALLGIVGGAALGIDYPILFVQEPWTGEEVAIGEAVDGSRVALLAPDGTLSVLSEGFASAADPCLSFDGERVLFAAKEEPDDPWDIWEMQVVDRKVKRITENLGDCREPIYLPRAAVDSPNFKDRVRWISFTSTAPGVWNDQKAEILTSLYALSLEPVPGRGEVLWRTTYNLGGDISPTLLADGRILFSARQRGSFALMTISWSGENLNPFYGSHDEMISQTAACEASDRMVVFIESDDGSSDAGGRLAAVSMRRPLKTHHVLSRGDTRYRTPRLLPDGRLIVSHAAGTGSYRLSVFDFETGMPGAAIFDDPDWNDIDAIAVAETTDPRGRIPMVEFASVLDVGSLKAVGQLQCLNVYDSDRPEADEIEVGQVKTVRFVEGVPSSVSADEDDFWRSIPWGKGEPPTTEWPPPGVTTRLLGEAPVEEDGSFYINVAGDVPFFIQTLDENGHALQTMRAWTWVRAGDQRGCIGCHEDKELAPENRATQALLRANPAMLTAPPEERKTIELEIDVRESR